MGVFAFSAPYLPWVLMAFSLCMHGTIPKDEILGSVVGHVWYFFADVWPSLHDGQRPMDPPQWWVRIWEGRRQGEEEDTPARGVEQDVVRAVATGVNVR